MATVREIAGYLEERVPSSLKLDFDNVGLLCGFPEREVSRVLVVLDITQQTIEEALSLHAELIVSHHPVIFTPLRRVCTDTPDAKRVIALLQGNLSAICLHTNLDALEGGVNTALTNAVGGEELEYTPDIGCFCRLPEAMPLSEFLAQTRTALSAPDMRYYDAGRRVEYLALCGGAGGDILYEAAQPPKTLSCRPSQKCCGRASRRSTYVFPGCRGRSRADSDSKTSIFAGLSP